jgi:hypothetical protein
MSSKVNTKGQFSVEYFVVLVLFLVFSLYFAFQLIEYYPEYMKNVKEEILRSDAYRLSEMLINDDGNPKDWDVTGSPTRIGLSYEMENKSNLVSMAKVVEMDALCTADYSNVKSLMGSEHDFYMVLEEVGEPLMIQCGPVPSDENIVIITRVVAFDNGNYGKLTLEMWR